jgi:hypothetical protein
MNERGNELAGDQQQTRNQLAEAERTLLGLQSLLAQTQEIVTNTRNLIKQLKTERARQAGAHP